MLRLLKSGLAVLTTLSILATPVLTSHADTQFQQPLEIPQDLSQTQNSKQTPSTHRVAIIGAGPAGSSTAHHLRHFASTKTNLSTTIFDQNPYIGGRTTTVNALNDPRYPVELGASIFVDINAILYNATRDFELPVDETIYESSGAKYELGVWDGEEFVVLIDAEEDGGGWMGRLRGWWGVARLLWRYGVSPVRLRGLQKGVIGRFLRMYEERTRGGDGGFPFDDLTKVAEEVDLLSVTSKSGSKLLAEGGISELFAREIVQASSRVNYAQNLDEFQGLETMVCMSTEGAMSIQGGNWQIFDRMVKGSGATIRLNTTVTGIETNKDGISYVTFRKSNYDGRNDDDGADENDKTENMNDTTTTEQFDTIILAHPHNPSKLQISPPPNHPRETPDYVSLHVTLFTTPFRPSPQFFNLPSTTPPSLIPDTILTTLPSTLDPSFLGRGTAGLGLTPFWSLSTLRVLNPSIDTFDSIPSYLTSGNIPLDSLHLNTTQYLYKIFSPEPLDAEFLADLFGWDWDGDMDVHGGSLESLPRDLLTWSHEKTWLSYPYLPPRDSFESWDVYKGMGGEMEGRVWSTAPMEVFISTMETMALSGRNVARLVVDLLEGRSQAVKSS